MATDLMAAHNQRMIMKNHNKENLYYGYGGIQLQQQQHRQTQQWQQQQNLAGAQTKFSALTTNISNTAGNVAANVPNLAAVPAATMMVPSSSTTATSGSQNSTTKLFERRHQQTAGLQYLNCNNFGYGLLSEFYEPPKPDTPPSRNIPYWIDPIWACDSTSIKEEPSAASTELLNIPIPELKTFDKLPIILTPYVLSLAKNSCFSFEQDKSKKI